MGRSLERPFPRNKSIFNFGPGKGFKPEVSASGVPFPEKSVGGPVSTLVNCFCIPTALVPDGDPDRSTPTLVPPVASSSSVDRLVLEDESTIQGDVHLVADRTTREAGDRGRPQDGAIQGFVSRIAEGTVPGPMTQNQQLMMILSVKRLDIEREATVRVAGGIRRWERNQPVIANS